jgi:hypothetical protein
MGTFYDYVIPWRELRPNRMLVKYYDPSATARAWVPALGFLLDVLHGTTLFLIMTGLPILLMWFVNRTLSWAPELGPMLRLSYDMDCVLGALNLFYFVTFLIKASIRAMRAA